MNPVFLLAIIAAISAFSCGKKGCADPAACNYDIEAKRGDESCRYANCKDSKGTEDASIAFYTGKSLGNGTFMDIFQGTSFVGRLQGACSPNAGCNSTCEMVHVTGLTDGSYSFFYHLIQQSSTNDYDTIERNRSVFVNLDPGCNPVGI